MIELFIRIVGTAVTAGWIMGAALLVRRLFRGAPKWTRGLLWALVAVRLLVPAPLYSAVSLIPPQAEQVVEAYTSPEGVRALDQVLPQIGFETLRDREVNAWERENGGHVFVSHSAPASTYLALMWAGGMAAMALYALVSWLRLRRRVWTAARLEGRVWVSDRIGAPFLLGLIRPRIYVPASLAPPALDYALAHERAHLRRGDHVWKPLGYALLAVYWFQLLAWVCYGLFCRDMELASDEAAAGDLDREGRAAYAQTLLDWAGPVRGEGACPLASGRSDVKGRVKAVLGYKKPARWLAGLAIAVFLAAGATFMTSPRTESGGQISVVITGAYNEDRAQLQPDTVPPVGPAAEGGRDPATDRGIGE